MIRRIDLLKVYMRSFFIQGSWNFERMLGLGFCFALIPIAKRLYSTNEEIKQFLKRHLQFFNAHPFTSSWLLGAIAKLEQQTITKESVDQRSLQVFKERLCGPLGAIGDTLFWRHIKPIAAMTGMLLSMLFGVIGVVIFLVIYNIPQFWFRMYALKQGFREGFDLVNRISKRRFQKIFNRLGLLGAGILGVAIVVSVQWATNNQITDIVVFAVAFIATIALLSSTRITISFLMLGFLALSVVVNFIL